MTYEYALQMTGILAGLSTLILGGLFIASRIYDRNTRRIEARGKQS